MTTERKTPEQVIAESLRNVTQKLHEPLYTQVLNEQAAYVAIELRAAGLLVGDPTEEQIERAAMALDEDAFCLTPEEFEREHGGAPEWSSQSQAGRQRAARATVRQVLTTVAGVAPIEEQVERDQARLAAEIHEAWEFQYDECDHGTYTGGHLNGEPYALCEITAERIVQRRAAAGVAPQDELPVASALPVGDDSGHAGDDDRGSREDGPEEEGCSHQVTVAVTPSPDREKLWSDAETMSLYWRDQGETRTADLIDDLAAAPVVDEAKLAEVICREIHSTRWTHRASSTPCDDCWRGSGAVTEALRGAR